MKNRIGVLGDIHCQDKKLEIALKHLKGTVDKIFCVGDIVDGKGNCQACIDELIKYEVLAVRGNHDRWILNNEMREIQSFTKRNELSVENINYLKGLPQTLGLVLNGYRILICHGINKNDMAMLKPDDYGYGLECKNELWEVIKSDDFDLMLSGHTHQDMVRKIDRLWIVNAGSFDSEENANFIILDLENKLVQTLRVKENGVEVKGSISINEE